MCIWICQVQIGMPEALGLSLLLDLSDLQHGALGVSGHFTPVQRNDETRYQS